MTGALIIHDNLGGQMLQGQLIVFLSAPVLAAVRLRSRSKKAINWLYL